MIVRIDCEGEISSRRNSYSAFINITTVPLLVHNCAGDLFLCAVIENYIGAKSVVAFTEYGCTDWNYFTGDCLYRNEISPEENYRGDVGDGNSINQPEPSVFPASAERTSKIRYLSIAS